MARTRKGRPVDGILLLDKPPGVSSNHVLQVAKRLFGAAKAGHTGALDPLATGMLPLTFGEATKFSQFLLNANKRYQTTAKLGIRTDSSDADGVVIATADVGADVTEARIAALLVEHFTGEIEQVPSMFSALKHNGQPLYKLARQGVKVEVKSRKVTIFSIEIMAFRGDEVDLDVRCSKGTYIRSIVEDLGLLLGCGAHVQVLRRLDSGPYRAKDMITLDELREIAEPKVPEEPQEGIQARLDALLLAPWSAIEDTPVISLAVEHCYLIRQGQKVSVEHPPVSLVRIHEQGSNTFLGIGEITDDQLLKPTRLLSTQAVS